MYPGEYTYFLNLLKTVADEHRLRMIGLMSQREYTVTEMAGVLRLSEPTVSHHVSRLHTAGLLHLRMAGTQRFYRINPERLAAFKAYCAQIERLPDQGDEVSDNGWIDALDWDEADKKVLRAYTFNGKLNHIPAKEKKWLVVLRWLATRFQTGVRYSEAQVNANLSEVNPDYATLRRDLVEFGFMRRERGGGDYWLTPEDEPVMPEPK